MDIVCLNGEFFPMDEARVPATDAGLLLGDGVFETIRVEGGQLLHHREHFARLARGVRVLEIPFVVQTEDLLALCHQAVDANGHRDARLRITVTRGPLRNLPITPSEGEPTLVITATALDPRHEETREAGWRAVVAPHPRNHRSPLATVKATSYLDSLLARRYALRLGFDEALMLNTDGLVAEAAMANVFLVRGGAVLTPPLADGALPGIMRGRTIEIAAKLGTECAEASLTVEDIVTADEVFFTNALIQIMPVVQVGEREIGDGEPGAVTRRLFAEHRREVADYLRAAKG